MTINFSISLTAIIGALVYLLLGMGGVMIHQTICHKDDRWTMGWAFLVSIFWLPMGVFGLFMITSI